MNVKSIILEGVLLIEPDIYGDERGFFLEQFEKELVCLPNHKKISLPYIDYIVKNIDVYYSKH